MSADVARHHLKPSKLALGLAAGTSAALCAAAVTGYHLDAVEVVGAFAIAGAIGAISIHHSRPHRQEPYVLRPIRSAAAGPVISAPTAAGYLAHPAHGAGAPAAAHTDAA